MKIFKFRMTGKQYSLIREYLKYGNNSEGAVIGFCGIGRYCDETMDSIVTSLQNGFDFLEDIENISDNGEKLHILAKKQKKNSIPIIIQKARITEKGNSSYSEQVANKLLDILSGCKQEEIRGVIAVINEEGRIQAQVIFMDGKSFQVNSVAVAGSNFNMWYADGYGDIEDQQISELELRTAQTFGRKTSLMLSKLSVGVVGVSGTGSPLVEMLYRLGIGELVLVDSDIIEIKNVGRIYNSTMQDAEEKRYKVDVIRDAVTRSRLNTSVTALPYDLFDPKAVRRISQCDVVFGCMDSVDGRDLLNRICAFYSIPYWDLGVKLNADGNGGVDQVCCTVHYLQPDGSSLLGRGVYTLERLKAEALKRASPQEYQKQIREKYIIGVNEERPAVISVNTMTASMAVNDFLARLHPYRDDDNSEYESVMLSLTQMRLISNPESEPCKILSKYVGRADMKPLLDMPSLSEGRSMLA